MNDDSQTTHQPLPGPSQSNALSTTEEIKTGIIPVSETPSGETPEVLKRLALQYPEKFQSDLDQLAMYDIILCHDLLS